MIKAQVVDTWVDWQGVKTPRLITEYDVKHTDVTGQSGADIIAGLNPNSVIIEIETDQATIDLIAADPNYYIAWSEEI